MGSLKVGTCQPKKTGTMKERTKNPDSGIFPTIGLDLLAKIRFPNAVGMLERSSATLIPLAMTACVVHFLENLAQRTFGISNKEGRSKKEALNEFQQYHILAIHSKSAWDLLIVELPCLSPLAG